jgi:hypothetical protein
VRYLVQHLMPGAMIFDCRMRGRHTSERSDCAFRPRRRKGEFDPASEKATTGGSVSSTVTHGWPR